MKRTAFFISTSLFLVATLQAQPEEGGLQGNPANPTPFEPTPGEVVTEFVDETELTEEQRERRARNIRSDELWKNADYRDYDPAFAELHRLSNEFANNKYRQALSSYQTGVNSIIKMRDEVEEYLRASERDMNLNEKWYWQVLDRRAREERTVGRMRRQAKNDAVMHFTRSINFLDEIINPELRESEAFKRLASAVYRNWAMYQYDLGNLPQTIVILEHYIEIDDNEREYPAHKYLAQAYAFQENMVERHRQGTTDMLYRFRYKKNVHLLRAAELKYGQDSPEYRHVVNLVNRDEIIATMP